MPRMVEMMTMVLPKSEGTPYLMGSTEVKTAEGKVEATSTTLLLSPVIPKRRVARSANMNPPTNLMNSPPTICRSRCQLVPFRDTPKVKAARGEAAEPANSKVVTRADGMEMAVIRKKNPAKTAHKMGDLTIVAKDFLVIPPVMMSMPKVKIKIDCIWS